MALVAMRHESLEKKMELLCRSLLLSVLLAAVQVHGQLPSTESFISIDCGSAGNYTDRDTGIPYTTDDQYIDTGTNHNVASNYIDSSIRKQYTTVRSFPDGDRNCYTLQPAIQGYKYLLRAGFMYGNYDGNNSVQANGPLLFDLNIGVNLWDTVNITTTSSTHVYEAISVALGDFVSVCLTRRSDSSSTPFISLLEMRQLKSTLYPTATSSNYIVFLARVNFGAAAGNIIRYPDDPYDRIWKPMNITDDVLTTASKVKNFQDDEFEVPSVVHQTAAVAANINDTTMGFYWNSESRSVGPYYYVNLHFCELELLPEKDVREFAVYLNDRTWEEHYRPPYLMSGYIYSTSQLSSYAQYNFSFSATKNATRPPLINAVEAYSLWSRADVSMTRIGDVEPMLAIKAEYKLKKNWMGDPCFPKTYVWDGITCSNGGNDSRIIALNLSSSGLVGQVSNSFSRLTKLESLDLSYNNLSGRVPDSLADISSLQVLDLTGNNITEIPDRLIRKANDGSLVLRTKSLNMTETSSDPKKKSPIAIIVTTSVVLVVLLALAVSIMLILKRRQQVVVSNAPVGQYVEEVPVRKMNHEEQQVQLESKQFTYLQLEIITDKFTQVIGQGGFGTVYHGYLEDSSEVAVKLLSGWSSQGMKEFLAETQNLRKVHHKNLVSLIGYCNDGEHMALVYEYLPEGSLHDHLRGKTSLARPLSWRERLQIVLEAAQGLDYLHKGCKQSIIHRDVKPSNILLGQHLEAKIADFGLSKAVLSDAQFVSTVAIVGTPGYMDPEYHRTLQLSEKSDVYSFGVVLLEIITGEPPIVQGPGKVHILERVKPMINRGNIEEIVDRSLRGKCDINSVWKVLELAMMCTSDYSDQRPTMADVVILLKESLTLETSRVRSEILYSERTTISETSAFGDISGTFAPSAR
ncbi:putative leucine-rich repeat receptor-like serine/threonine-protein kinase At2g19230 [Typha angustifolia]|uniref:putative leucine-rich repeat receptor-like serine/threonine-protein kinase At2g19230 n=1 Tax=Typha angustifolia TaxID=59011 RepID=UPI003C2CBBA0